ncbi:MAG: hypothetical protein HC820_09575 [Hydrococcus sp. RM1_1_31]|nr:hypothetical protein [Hydrococcus sp. RM1_1_31]
MYTVLDRLEDRQLITKRRSLTDARRWVYCLPEYNTNEGNTTEDFNSTSWDSPPPTFFPSSVELMPESTTRKELEDSQHPFNTYSTVIQHTQNVELDKNSQTSYETRNIKPQKFIQHATKDEGERVGVEQVRSENILQVEQPVDSFTTQEDTTCQTNSQDPTSQQEAFNQKYQPVEVLNSDGEWISGYFVHKYLVVANLEGIERKYALYDESGSLYTFWGEIRLPRIGN